MACSDYPHTEGTATPLDDYERSTGALRPAEATDFFAGNVRFLLRQSA